MDAKLMLLCAALLVFALQNVVIAEFHFNRVFPKQDELEKLGLKCIPGRTTIKIQEKPIVPEAKQFGSEEEEEDLRRTHMRFQTSEEYCQVCVCSVEAKDEYCSNRPAMNVNECMLLAKVMERFHSNEPYDHERTLAYMIRRDYIWHSDEIPARPNAKCKRGHSYFSNSITANDTDLDVSSEVTSLLDYSNKSVCFYCVCSVSGDAAGCLSRKPWFCQYYRDIRNPKAIRDKYKKLFGQDRPAYFRTISYRLRRTMDDGMFDLVENVGEGSESQKCAPFVSMYTDCTKDNLCEGCNKCTCSADAKWVCETYSECASNRRTEDEDELIDDQKIDNAMDWLLQEMNLKQPKVEKKIVLSQPGLILPDKVLDVHAVTTESPDLVVPSLIMQEEDELLSLLRDKRSVDKNDVDKGKDNGTVIFHHTVDELNEDTLKNSNISGTLQASKIDMIPKTSRRSSMNNSTSKSLQIDFTPPITNQHAADNKVDTPAIHDDQVDLLVHHKVYEIVGNQSQATRDKDLSKILVNELKGGESEIIGDKKSSIISNITFTSENDTLTAIAFIAGNLLNKLWNMEKDTSDSLETENLKHKKINDLLELFKEPLNLRQETFLKNALQHLSSAIKNKDIGNVSLCENIEELKKISGLNGELDQEYMVTEGGVISEKHIASEEDILTENEGGNAPQLNQKAATAAALSKINNVLDLIKKYENVQNSLSNKKSKSMMKTLTRISPEKKLTDEENTTLNVFGNVLESLTKLLIPNKKSKKIVKAIKNKNAFRVDKHIKSPFKYLNITDRNLTAKDRIVLDYLNLIQNSPNCLLEKPQKKSKPLNIEGDILLNLSEFFKIKSMSDLLKLVEEKPTEEPVLRSKSTTEMITTKDDTTQTKTQAAEKGNAKFETTKEKLKSHLKTILEDLIELQNISGKSTNGKNIEIAEALPCIYNLLNANKGSNNTTEARSQSKKDKPINESVDHINKVRKAFVNLKKELRRTLQTRRVNTRIESMPKSATVWERTILNLNNEHNIKTRRNSQSREPMSFETIRDMIESIDDSASNSYKSMASSTEVPEIEKLILLKALAADTKRYIAALEDIKQSMEAMDNLQVDQQEVISEFLDNVNTNLNLSEKVANNLDKPRYGQQLSNQKQEPATRFKIMNSIKIAAVLGRNNVKLNRDQIVNQLIRNRMNYYLKMKEATGDVKGNINRDLAKRIILHLETGNDKLARELYKLFVTQNKKKTATSNDQTSDSFKYSDAQITEKLQYQIPAPLIQFEESKASVKDMPWANQEQLIRQLVNMKNMKVYK